MGISEVARVLSQVPTLLALKKGMQPRPASDPDCIGAQVERTAARFGDRLAILFEGREISWREFNALANRYAGAFRAQGLRHGDAACLFMENRIEFLATLVALNKLGVVVGLINTNLRGKALIHCISTTRSKVLVFGEELLSSLEGVRAQLPLAAGSGWIFVPDTAKIPGPNWALNLADASGDQPSANPPETAAAKLADNAMYVFTSGTTGLPKAAILTNLRFLFGAFMSSKAGLKCSERDRIYICLPLYHSTGLTVGVGASFASGASIFLRRKFSASNFLAEVRQYQTSCLVYIGELCRYLMSTPARPDDHDNPLRNIIGNGLRPDVWLDFKQRYGIERICEFYAASEGNVSFANLLNKDCTIGMTASKIALVKYDVDNDQIVTDANGHCVETESGTPGLLIAEINDAAVFEGYTSPEATESKILRNAFQDGDAWFNSGDLLKEVDVGFSLGYAHYQFVDRVGDTFRWKSENVSTNEVGEILNGFDQIKLTNVYGVVVPNTDGRAGMAAVTLNDDAQVLDVERFSHYVKEQLPAYARPVFVRVQPDMDITGTFKMVKSDLRKQGYDLPTVTDPLLVMKPGSATYEPLDQAFADRIAAGEAGY